VHCEVFFWILNWYFKVGCDMVGVLVHMITGERMILGNHMLWFHIRNFDIYKM
jgi:hypothetical protein